MTSATIDKTVTAQLEANAAVIERYLASKRTRWRDTTMRLRRGLVRSLGERLPVPLTEATEDHLVEWHEWLTGPRPSASLDAPRG